MIATTPTTRTGTTLTPAQLDARRRIGLAIRGDRGPRGGAFSEGSRYMDMGTERKIDALKRITGSRVVEFLDAKRTGEDPTGTLGGGWASMHDLRKKCFGGKPDEGTGLMVVVQDLVRAGTLEARGGGLDDFKSTFMVRTRRAAREHVEKKPQE